MDELEKKQEASWSSTVDVYLVASYSRIIDIDTLNQRFQADAIIESRWYDPNIKNINDLFDEKKIWKPELYIENGVKDVREEVKYQVVEDLFPEASNQKPRYMVSELRKVTGLFYEHLELEDFPLDVQDLTITVASKKPNKMVNLIPLQNEVKTLNMSHTLDRSMWKMHNIILTRKFTINREYTFGTREYPSVRISAKVLRLSGFFIWNALLPVFLITLASLTPFSVALDKVPSRLATTCTLIFTSVGIRWTIGRLLPTVSYLTSLDKYSISTLFIITIELCYHAIMGRYFKSFNTMERANYVDGIFFFIFCFLIFLKELVFIKWYFRANSYRKKVEAHEICCLNDDVSYYSVDSDDEKAVCFGLSKLWTENLDYSFEIKKKEFYEKNNII
jgi:hypothetical protein